MAAWAFGLNQAIIALGRLEKMTREAHLGIHLKMIRPLEMAVAGTTGNGYPGDVGPYMTLVGVLILLVFEFLVIEFCHVVASVSQA